MRAEHVIAVYEGKYSAEDVIGAATLPEFKPLLSLKLENLLVKPGFSRKRARRVVRRTADLVGEGRSLDELTVAWLLDSRAGGRRYLAWHEALGTFDSSLPGEGFPFAGLGSAPAPKEVQLRERTGTRAWDNLPRYAGRHSTGHRADPYYEFLVGSDGRLAWTTGSMVRAMARRGAVDARAPMPPEQLALTPAQARARLNPGDPKWRELLAFLGVLHGWGTVTGAQMAALTGCPRLATARHPLVAAASALGLVDLALTHASRSHSLLANDVVYRAGRGKAFDREIAPLLTTAERIAVTGGHTWRSANWFDRHDLIAVELAQRIAEYVDGVEAVVAPRFSELSLVLAGSAEAATLLPAPDSRDVARSRRAGDFTLVSSSGLRVVVEITTTVNKEFDDKVQKWCEFLTWRPLERCGITVLFVDARRRSPGDGELAGRVAQIVRRWAGADFAAVAARVGVVAWSEWFPAPGMVDGSFFSLATGAAGVRSLLALDLEPRGWEPMAVVSAASVLLSTPAVKRTACHRPDLLPVCLAALELREIPVAPPRRPGRVKGVQVGSARCAAGAVALPVRLDWPCLGSLGGLPPLRPPAVARRSRL